MRRALLTLALAPVALLAAYASACGEQASHVYPGRLFVEGRECLGSKSSVDVVDGEQAGECGPICLAQSKADGGRSIYVATMCPPYPYAIDASGSDPACARALGAFARNDSCLLDGGS